MKTLIRLAAAAALAVTLLLAVSVTAFAAYAKPSELGDLDGVGGGDGTWPVAPGSYDPALDGAGIKPGTHVYAAYDFDFATFVGKPKPVPGAIDGYEKVDRIADMRKGTWWTGDINGYAYVLVYGEPGSAVPPVLKYITIGIVCAAIAGGIVYVNLKSRKILAAAGEV